MCDIHGKKLEYFCLKHEGYYCRRCKNKDHEVHPCECLHVRDVYDRLQLEMEENIQDLIRLRDRSKRILDGSYQRNLLYRVNDEEIHLDRFYRDMKKKLKETKMKIKAFTADELSELLRQQLHGFMSKPIPVKFTRIDKPKEMVNQLKDVKKQIQAANLLFYSLPNYIEVTVDSKFMKLLTYNGDPVVIRGRPKYLSYNQVSSDEEYNDANDENDLLFEKESDQMNGNVDNKDDFDEKNRRLVTFKAKQKDRIPDYYHDVDDKGTERTEENSDSLAFSGVLKWQNNAPSFTLTGTTTRPAQNSLKSARLPNKWEKQIAAAKERMKLPPVSLTPQPVKNRRSQIFQNSSKSVPDDALTDKPMKKLFLRNAKSSKYIIKDKTQLDGCEDALILKESLILSLGNKVQKRDRKGVKLIVEMKLAYCSTMCVIRGSDTQIAVLQLQKCINVLDTLYGLSVLYKIKIQQAYVDFCHIGSTDDGPHHPSYVFAAVYKGYARQPVNCVDIVQARETRRPGRPPVYEILAKELNIAKDGFTITEIYGISGFEDGHIVMGIGDAVICVNESGRLVWRRPVPRSVSGVLCTKSLIYVCVQDEKRVVTFNKGGFVTDENVITDIGLIPCKLSANWDTLLVKDFKTKKWALILFKHGLFII